jgi:hypothetical protein
MKIMPSSKYLLLLLILTVLNSCCTKEECIGPELSGYIQLEKFDINDLDSVNIKIYADHNFSSVVSSNNYPIKYHDGSHFINDFYPDLNKGYQLTLYPINLTYDISNFTTKEEKCNRCFLISPDWANFELLNSYTVNNQIQYGQITISK